jgi:GAF domain-containing protein
MMGTHRGRRSTGERFELDPDYVVASVRETGEAARFDTDDPAAAEMPEPVRAEGIRSALASPIVVDGELWGAITVASFEGSFPPETEQRLTDFTELLAAAVANAESRQAVTRTRRGTGSAAACRDARRRATRHRPEVFDAVATEVGKLLDTDITIVGRYDADGMATAIGNWSAAGEGVPVGTRSAIGGRNVLTIVAETGKPARMDGYDDASGEAAEIARRYGWRSSIAAPILVEGRLWGVMLVATQRPEPFFTGAEHKLAAFTDLIATAVANAQAHDELRRFGDEQAGARTGCEARRRRGFTGAGLRRGRAEVSSLLGLERTELVRYDGDSGTVIAATATIRSRPATRGRSRAQVSWRRSPGPRAPRASTTTPTWRARSHARPVAPASSRRSALRSRSKVACGA